MNNECRAGFQMLIALVVIVVSLARMVSARGSCCPQVSTALCRSDEAHVADS